MNINICKTFVAVVENESVSKASECIYLTQSAISQQIKSLENSLGVELFIRTPSGMLLTQYGKIYYQYAQQMISLSKQMKISINAIKEKNRTLYIFSTPVMHSYALPCTLFHLKKYCPSYELKIETMPSQLIEENILKGNGDIGIIVGKPLNSNLMSKMIMTDNIVLVSDYNMDIPDIIDCEDLTRYPIILPSFRCRSRTVINHYLDKIKVDIANLQILYDLDSTESMKTSVMKGYSLAFMPYIGIKKELYNKQLKIIQLSCDRLENEYYIIRSKTKSNLDDDLNRIIRNLEIIFSETAC